MLYLLLFSVRILFICLECRSDWVCVCCGVTECLSAVVWLSVYLRWCDWVCVCCGVMCVCLLWQVAAIACVVSYWQELHDELYGKQRRILYYKQLSNIRTAALSGAMTPYRSHIGSQTTLITSQGAVNTGYVEKYWHFVPWLELSACVNQYLNCVYNTCSSLWLTLCVCRNSWNVSNCGRL